MKMSPNTVRSRNRLKVERMLPLMSIINGALIAVYSPRGSYTNNGAINERNDVLQN